MKSLDEYILLAGKDGQTRSGIILGIRMVLLGLKDLALIDADLQNHNLVVFVETDRCLPDAIELVTGCRLGNRTLKLRDMGKLAATFVNLPADRAVRVSAQERANQRVEHLFPELEREEALAKAYRLLSDEELLARQWVRVTLSPEEVPGYHAARVICGNCGEGIAFHKEISDGSRTLCRSCSGLGYFDLSLPITRST